MGKTDSAKPVTIENTSDFPLVAPFDGNEPLEWSEQAIADLAKQPPEELSKHIEKLLGWFLQEDELVKGLPGNEYWEAGHYMAKALLAARELQRSSVPS